jgi:hypothetical protein
MRRHARGLVRLGVAASGAVIVFGRPGAISPRASGVADPPAESDDAWTRLRRPLHLPRVDPGDECPTSSGSRARTYSPRFGSAYALGLGPVYAVVDVSDPGTADSHVRFRPATGLAKGRQVFKILFIVAPKYAGPVLVRGRRIDGVDVVKFPRFEAPPTSELRIPGVHDGDAWRDSPTRSYVKGAGCYAYQLDGFSFSRIVVLNAHN